MLLIFLMIAVSPWFYVNILNFKHFNALEFENEERSFQGLDKTILREVLYNTFDIVTEEVLMDRIFTVWDKGNLGLLTPECWLAGLSIFIKGTLGEKMLFCFSVYDVNSDGVITKDEMFSLLK